MNFFSLTHVINSLFFGCAPNIAAGRCKAKAQLSLTCCCSSSSSSNSSCRILYVETKVDDNDEYRQSKLFHLLYLLIYTATFSCSFQCPGSEAAFSLLLLLAILQKHTGGVGQHVHTSPHGCGDEGVAGRLVGQTLHLD